MGYTSLSFIVFCIAVCLVFFCIPRKYRWPWLLAMSLLFHFIASKALTLYLVGDIVVVWLCGLLIQRKKDKFNAIKKEIDKAERKIVKKQFEKREKLIEFIGIAVLLSVLLVLKYSPMFVSGAFGLARLFGANAETPLIRFALPLGISYYTLTGISYMADIRMGKLTAEKNPLRLATFISFFPHIVEGPFSRYGDLTPTLFMPDAFDYDRFRAGLLRVIWGFGKKMILADRAAFVVNPVFADPGAFRGPHIFAAMALYTVQIYAEFSGAMDIVTGLCEMMGIHLAENFRQPFFSRSIDEFWQRWHITLGAWLRDYVFYPITFSKGMQKLSAKCREKLGGYYGAILPATLALFAVWFLIGLWHGASLKYVFYGLYYYILMTIAKLAKPATDKLRINRDTRLYRGFEIGRTCLAVLVGMTIFRADTVGQAFSMTAMIFTRPSVAAFTDGSLFAFDKFSWPDAVIIVLALAAVIFVDIRKESGHSPRETLVKQKHGVFAWIAVVLGLLLLMILGIYGQGSGASPLIYGQF